MNFLVTLLGCPDFFSLLGILTIRFRKKSADRLQKTRKRRKTEEKEKEKKSTDDLCGNSGSVSQADEDPYTTCFFKFSYDEFTNLKQVGTGSYGAVYEASHATFGNVCVKTSKAYNEAGVKILQNEILNLKRISHPNIINIYGVILQANLYGFVMQFMEGGSVYNVIRHSDVFVDKKKRLFWIIQVGRALTYLHLNNIVHRDVKPGNMLLCSRLQSLRLCDFGFATYTNKFEKEFVGTPMYVAPEVLSPHKCETSLDIYSLSISTWEILTTRNTYLFDVAVLILSHHKPPIDCDYIGDDEICCYIKRSWSSDPTERPTAREFTQFFCEKWTNLATDPVQSTNDSDDNIVHTSKLKPLSLPELEPGVQSFTQADFAGINEIGHGGFGTVFRSHHSQFGDVAVKTFKNNWSLDVKREILHMMKNSIHTNIVRFYGVLQEPGNTTPNGFVMELGDESLKEALHKNKEPINVYLKYDWICQAGRALDYFHSKNLVHRDIKPENMLLFNNFKSLRICDMGMVRHSDDSFSGKLIGSYKYCAPEVTLKKTETYNYHLDIYSFAITIWEILCRREPFDHITKDNSPIELAYKAAKHGVRPENSDVLDAETWALLNKAWDEQPFNRPKASDIVDFFNKKLEMNGGSEEDEDRE